MTGVTAPQPPTLHAALVRAFRDAKAPGSLVTPLVADPEAAADLAVKRCAAFLRHEAARMSQADRLLGAAVARSLANEIDPLGPVMGAPATGGTT